LIKGVIGKGTFFSSTAGIPSHLLTDYAEERLKPISSIYPDNSFYIHRTSKALNPTFRISYIISPQKYVKILSHSINNLTWMSSPMTAEIVSLLQATSKYDEIVIIKQSILKKRNQIADDILKVFNRSG